MDRDDKVALFAVGVLAVLWLAAGDVMAVVDHSWIPFLGMALTLVAVAALVTVLLVVIWLGEKIFREG